MKTLGIIVPIYNIKKEWIKTCLDSIVSAYELLDGDLDVIVVDNGSTDKTILPWLQENYSKYSDFMEIKRLDENRGKPSATWYGLNNINSKYIQVLDSDDWLKLDELKATVKQIKKNPADFYLLNYTYYNNQTGRPKTRRVVKYNKNKNHRVYSNRKIHKNMKRTVWHFDTNAILNRKFMMEKNNFVFPEGMTAYEDVYINMWNISKAKKIIHINKSIYYYRIKLEGANLSSNEAFIKKLPEYKKMVDALAVLDYSNKFVQRHMVYHFALQAIAWSFWTNNITDGLFGNDMVKEQMEMLKKVNPYLYKRVNSINPKNFNLYNLAMWNGYNPMLKPVGNMIRKFRD